MSITDELRGFASNWDWLDRGSGATERKILTIADRIDAEHKREIDHACKQYDNAVAERGWIRLPRDADGKSIHVGDEMEHIELGYVLKVIAVGVDCFIAWNTHLNRYCQYDSKLFRHHHEPTVEDVLREFGDKYCDMVAGSDKERELVAEYAAKLQLRGDGE